MRQMGEDPRTVRDAGDRGAGAGQAAAERQPRRSMFDGFRPAPQRPAPESTPAGEREKAAPKRGPFDGLKLSAAPLKGAEGAEESRVGKECSRTSRSRWSENHYNQP